ncbi:alpha/beta hydrolase family protein [Mycobacterium xenopi 4042]|uniref:Alpha/beta hydrolase family protein n=1 Tax=Mycobacterium xenopi 4042 TaxID=1299334 RepID=X8CL48_MYCXE|nr:alpha/beta hydrolase family protein [Mycobacterium xenopi 4042]
MVGMSLGGLTAVSLGAAAPELVRELVLVDVTPSSLQRHAELTDAQRGTVALMHGEREFPASRRCWSRLSPPRRTAT